MKTIIAALIICALFASCDKESYNEPMDQYVAAERNNPPPSKFVGKWASVFSKEELLVTLTDGALVMNLEKYGKGTIAIDLTDNTIYKANVSNRLYSVHYNGQNIVLSNGMAEYEKYVTLTIDNECIARMILYVPAAVTPDEPEQPEQPTEPENPVNVN